MDYDTHPAAVLGVVPVVLVLSDCFHCIRQLKLETGKIVLGSGRNRNNIISAPERAGPRDNASGTRGRRVHVARGSIVLSKLIGKLAKWFCWSGANSFTRFGYRANRAAITAHYNRPAFVNWTGRLLYLRRYYNIEYSITI